ncbi:hypothetical protein Hanom_Chr07g00671001 [Helianthus anomalus]
MKKKSTLLDPDGKNKPLDESRKTSQTSGTKMPFYSSQSFYWFNEIQSYL